MLTVSRMTNHDVEQAALDTAYGALDAKLTSTRERLQVLGEQRTSHAQSRLENEALTETLAQRLAALAAAERRLCFGRLDLESGEQRYIGRIGLTDDDLQRLQLDWRAPAAAPFYQASPTNPMGVSRRRHITTDDRRVTALYDDVFDFDGVDASTLAGDSVLLAALNRARTGKMGEIVETIQAEQDAVGRSDTPGILVVDGGPGTGKTVVALHRAAYLLYRDRARLERAGVLVVGPSSRFLEYIDNVLPALGETGVVLATVADLYPGITPTLVDDAATAQVKAGLAMAEVMANAVRQYRQRPDQGISITFGTDTIKMSAKAIDDATVRAFNEDPRHNIARVKFLTVLMNQIATKLADKRGVDPSDPYERPEILDEIRQTPQARRVLNAMWMPVSPERLLERLYTEPDRLSRAARRLLSVDEQRLLARDPSLTGRFAVADIPLLDELAELLGPSDTGPRMAHSYLETEDAERAAHGTGVSADDLLDRYHGGNDLGSIAERALSDREWVYGHAIVDEAQELTPMQWRLLMRRVPSRSMTVVGDQLQASTPGAPGSWNVLDELAPQRWNKVTLQVNYRTPAAIMALADHFMAANGITTSTRAVREGDSDPVVTSCADLGELENEVRLWAAAGTGLHAVIAPVELHDRFDGLAVYTPEEVKGLEFDRVSVVEPARLLAGYSQASLYVTLTRATQELQIVHTEPLPIGFTR